jgi:hypothetical protein
MPRPDENEKKTRPTKEKLQGKMFVKGQEIPMDIDVETTPNASGGYDTKVKLPSFG